MKLALITERLADTLVEPKSFQNTVLAMQAPANTVRQADLWTLLDCPLVSNKANFTITVT